jgi:hypothetical protein
MKAVSDKMHWSKNIKVAQLSLSLLTEILHILLPWIGNVRKIISCNIITGAEEHETCICLRGSSHHSNTHSLGCTVWLVHSSTPPLHLVTHPIYEAACSHNSVHAVTHATFSLYAHRCVALACSGNSSRYLKKRKLYSMNRSRFRDTSTRWRDYVV